MLTTREITPSGFGSKVRAWDKVELLQEWREAWADHCNAALADSGHASRVDHRTLCSSGTTTGNPPGTTASPANCYTSTSRNSRYT